MNGTHNFPVVGAGYHLEVIMSPWPQPTEDGALCCICFEWTHIDNLNVDPVDGRKEDVCYDCRDK